MWEQFVNTRNQKLDKRMNVVNASVHPYKKNYLLRLVVHSVRKTFKGEFITHAAIVLEGNRIAYPREEVCDTMYYDSWKSEKGRCHIHKKVRT